MSIDSTGQTALHYGSKYGHRDIVKYLIAFAPNSIINMVDNAKYVSNIYGISQINKCFNYICPLNRGQTALHKAASNKQRGICYMLVAAGANLTMKDAEGQTPMMHAFQADDQDLATYLESKMNHSKPKRFYVEFVSNI